MMANEEVVTKIDSSTGFHSSSMDIMSPNPTNDTEVNQMDIQNQITYENEECDEDITYQYPSVKSD